MKRFQFISVVVIVIIVLTVGIGAAYTVSPDKTGSEQPQASLTFGPIITTFTFIVTIPDPNLNEALHQKLSKPMSEGITYADLASIAGELWLHDRDIDDAEGLQYCTSISELHLNNNNLSSLPDMSGMLSLTRINLGFNDFNELSEELCHIPNLERIDLNHNPVEAIFPSIGAAHSIKHINLISCNFSYFPDVITSSTSIEYLWLNDNAMDMIPSSINAMSSLKSLLMQNNEVSSIPEELYTMSQIETLNLGGNNLTSVSSSIGGMTSLESLRLNDNDIESIPEDIYSISSLTFLDVNHNRLYSLPSGISASNISVLRARDNRISSLPSDIGSSQLYALDLMANRLRELPSGIKDISWDYFNVEFNFLDVSSGSAARTIIDNTASFTKLFERQLKPIDQVITVPTDTSIMISWDAGQDGSNGGATWSVDSYKIFDDGFSSIGETLPSELSFEHTGLSPETMYQYNVGVEYRIVYPAEELDILLRVYTEAEATTSAFQAETTPSPTIEVVQEQTQPSDEEEDSEATIEDAKDNAEASQAEETGEEQSKAAFPIWAIIVIAVLGLGIIGTGVTLIVMKAKGRKTPQQKKG